MKHAQPIAAAGAFLAGLASIVTGCFLLSDWLGFITLGAALCVVGVGMHVNGKGKEPKAA